MEKFGQDRHGMQIKGTINANFLTLYAIKPNHPDYLITMIHKKDLTKRLNVLTSRDTKEHQQTWIKRLFQFHEEPTRELTLTYDSIGPIVTVHTRNTLTGYELEMKDFVNGVFKTVEITDEKHEIK